MNQIFLNKSRSLIVAATLLLLQACGGGGGGAGTVSSTVSGTAAVGAAIIGTVTLRDSNATTADRTALTSATGAYSIDVSGLTAPFMLRVTGMAAGTATSYTLHSVASAAGITNITPFTDAIVARLASAMPGTAAADAAACFADPATCNFATTFTQANLNMAEADVQAMLVAAGITGMSAANIDLMSTSFTGGSHAGMDAMLDQFATMTMPAGDVILTFADGSTTTVTIAANSTPQQIMDAFAGIDFSTVTGGTFTGASGIAFTGTGGFTMPTGQFGTMTMTPGTVTLTDANGATVATVVITADSTPETIRADFAVIDFTTVTGGSFIPA